MDLDKPFSSPPFQRRTERFIPKLVDIDGYHIGVIVKLYKSLESLPLKSCFDLRESIFLDLLNALLNGALIRYGCPEHSHGIVHDVLRQVRLNILQLSLYP